jgi:hypothetical protein
MVEFRDLTIKMKPTMKREELDDLCVFIGCSLRESGYVTSAACEAFIDDVLKQELEEVVMQR